MSKLRVYELAKELGVSPKTLVARLQEMGEFVRSASSTLEPPVVRRLRDEFGGSAAVPETPALREPSSATTGYITEEPDVGTTLRPRSSTPPLEVGREDVVVQLPGLFSDGQVDQIVNACTRAVRDGNRSVHLSLTDAHRFFPSAVVPVAAVLQHFRAGGLQVWLRDAPPILEKMAVRNPLEVAQRTLDEEGEVLSRVWYFTDHKQANLVTSAYMDVFRRRVQCSEGVLEALEWCLYEVLDNVCQHSTPDGDGVGFVMSQVHPQQKRLSICVADTGQGIRKSLSTSGLYRPKTAADALTLAIKEGVTRNKTTNQGNGLFGLYSIVDQNKGTLNLRSGPGRLTFRGGAASKFDNGLTYLGPGADGTTVDFQLSVDKPVKLADVFGAAAGSSLWLESLETPRGNLVVKIREHAGGAGSRAAARELRTYLENVRVASGAAVELDFEGQVVVSSSFADEVIGKLVADMGYLAFSETYRMTNMNATVRALIDTAVAKRLAASVSQQPSTK